VVQALLVIAALVVPGCTLHSSSHAMSSRPAGAAETSVVSSPIVDLGKQPKPVSYWDSALHVAPPGNAKAGLAPLGAYARLCKQDRGGCLLGRPTVILALVKSDVDGRGSRSRPRLSYLFTWHFVGCSSAGPPPRSTPTSPTKCIQQEAVDATTGDIDTNIYLQGTS
jgi:hypothetical protein